MASNKQKENGKTGVADSTRRTLQFNERTHRTLNAELSHLERSRREIMRDLRRIKKIKTTLNDQIRTVLEHKSMNRSISDTSVYESGSRFPSVERRGARPRFYSDIGPMDRLIANERCRLEKLRPRNETNLNVLNEDEQAKCNDATGSRTNPHEDHHEDGLVEGYRTNQELRSEILIRSRFNQLGSKYVGKEFTEKKLKRPYAKDRRREDGTGQSPKHRSDVLSLKAHQRKSNLAANGEKVGESTNGVSLKLSTLSIKEPLEDENGNELELRVANKDSSTTKESATVVNTTEQIPPKSNTCTARDGQDAEFPSQKPDGKRNSSLPPQRRTSVPSVGGLDIDSLKVKQEALLPIIPSELRSKRQSKVPNCLEQAFMVCTVVNSDSKDLKHERKRRFANFVDLIVKRRKVINAWEPLMGKIGEIHSDDEV